MSGGKKELWDRWGSYLETYKIVFAFLEFCWYGSGYLLRHFCLSRILSRWFVSLSASSPFVLLFINHLLIIINYYLSIAYIAFSAWRCSQQWLGEAKASRRALLLFQSQPEEAAALAPERGQASTRSGWCPWMCWRLGTRVRTHGTSREVERKLYSSRWENCIHWWWGTSVLFCHWKMLLKYQCQKAFSLSWYTLFVGYNYFPRSKKVFCGKAARWTSTLCLPSRRLSRFKRWFPLHQNMIPADSSR